MSVFSPHYKLGASILYFLYRTKKKNRGQKGGGGQFSAKNRGRPLWKAPYMIINTKILCGLLKLDDDVYGQPLI